MGPLNWRQASRQAKSVSRRDVRIDFWLLRTSVARRQAPKFKPSKLAALLDGQCTRQLLLILHRLAVTEVLVRFSLSKI